MARIEVRDRGVVYGGKVLGQVGSLLLDPTEAGKLGYPASTGQLPGRMDGVIGFGPGQVIGLEIKRNGDLGSSIRSRRMARQVRTMLGLCDGAVIVIMGCQDWEGDPSIPQYLAAAQRLGVAILPLDIDDPAMITAFAKQWAHGNPLRAVAGTDRHRQEENGPGWFLRNFKGLGKQTAQRIHDHFGSTEAALKAALADGAGVWPGANRTVKEAFKEAMR